MTPDGATPADASAPAVTIREMVLDHEGRLSSVERFVSRAEPTLFDQESGLVVIVRELVDARNEREAQMRLIRWAVTFAGAGLLVGLANAVLQAAGVIK